MCVYEHVHSNTIELLNVNCKDRWTRQNCTLGYSTKLQLNGLSNSVSHIADAYTDIKHMDKYSINVTACLAYRLHRILTTDECS